MKKIAAGIIGLGTVGRGVLELLQNRQLLIQERTGLSIEVAGICDRSYHKKTGIIGNIPATDNPAELIENPDIDIIVELIGGIDPAREYLLAAMNQGKAVVTANKALLAGHGQEIFATSNKNQVEIGLEAAVAGAIPVIQTLRRGLVINEFTGIFGILNGTCNFILSQMESGMEYREALALAQEKGFAEADPTFDVSGRDAAQKLAILVSLTSGYLFQEKDVQTEGIPGISSLDMMVAREMGHVIRLLAVARKENDGILLRVHPALVPENHMLASVRDENNAIFFNTDASGPALLMGKGAGSLPTAAAVISDLVAIGRRTGTEPEIWMSSFQSHPVCKSVPGRYYLRFRSEDRPGVLADIARILAEHDISIATVHQYEGPSPVDVIVITHQAAEEKMLAALEIIDHKDFIHGKTVHLRIEDSLST